MSAGHWCRGCRLSMQAEAEAEAGAGATPCDEMVDGRAAPRPPRSRRVRGVVVFMNVRIGSSLPARRIGGAAGGEPVRPLHEAGVVQPSADRKVRRPASSPRPPSHPPSHTSRASSHRLHVSSRAPRRPPRATPSLPRHAGFFPAAIARPPPPPPSPPPPSPPLRARAVEPRAATHAVVQISERCAWIYRVCLHARARSAPDRLESSMSARERLPGPRPCMSGYPLMRAL